MKKIFTIMSACALALAIGGTVFAQGPMGGCNECAQRGQQPQASGQTDQNRKFQMDTIDLRQEMMLKRFEMQRENLKGLPDAGKIAVLKADILAIQARINAIRVQSGLPENSKRDGECFKMDGNCFKQDGMGGCNKQNGKMGGCNGQPCGQK
jgi:hypothetical protein